MLAVLIEGRTIRAIGRRAKVPGARRLRRHGPTTTRDATLLPGLVDGHTHLVAPGDGTRGDVIGAEAERSCCCARPRTRRPPLRSGVTTLRENGAKGASRSSSREAIARGVTPGPADDRLRPAGHHHRRSPPLLRRRDQRRRTASGTTIRQLVKEGADFVKIVSVGRQHALLASLPAAFTPPRAGGHRGRDAPVRGACARPTPCPDQAHRRLPRRGRGHDHPRQHERRAGRYIYRPDLTERFVAQGTWVNPTMHDIRAWIWHYRDAAGGERRHAVRRGRGGGRHPPLLRREARRRAPLPRGRRAAHGRLRLAWGRSPGRRRGWRSTPSPMPGCPLPRRS